MNIDYSINKMSSLKKLQTAYEQISEGGDYWFIRHSLRALMRLGSELEEITSCDVWQLLDEGKIKPNNPRSMGLVFKIAKRNNIIESTGNYRPSRRKQANQRPVRIWRFVK